MSFGNHFDEAVSPSTFVFSPSVACLTPWLSRGFHSLSLFFLVFLISWARALEKTRREGEEDKTAPRVEAREREREREKRRERERRERERDGQRVNLACVDERLAGMPVPSGKGGEENCGGVMNGLSEIPMAPTLRPTKEEFQDPLAYIRAIKSKGYDRYGIVKIVPPPDWRPPFAIDKQSFKFHTRVQSINELQRRHIIAAKSQAFRDKLDGFFRSRGQKPPKLPIMYGQKINTFKLFSAVIKRGGYDSVTKNKKWKEVGKLIVSKHKQITNLSFLVRVAYERSLLDFERYVEECCEYLKLDTSHLDALSNVCVSGDQDQQDKLEKVLSDSGVKQEMAEPTKVEASPMKERMHTDIKEEEGEEEKEEDTEMEALDGLIGLTTTNGSSKRLDLVEIKQEEGGKDEDEEEEVEIKEEETQEEVKEEVKEECSEEEMRDKKRKAKIDLISNDDNDINVEFIENMLPQQKGEDESVNVEDVFCELCGGGAHEDQIILCDKCDKGFHTFCLAPPLDEIPKGDWCCPHCISSATDDLAFTDGSDFTLEEFEIWDRKFKDSWFLEKGFTSKPNWSEVEGAFWNIVENSDEPVEVYYGADLDSGKLGSGFPHERHGFTGQYAESPWNLNNLPKLGGEHCSMLRHVTDNINGVIVPWVYVGMTFSSFCWHVEDHMFYSINYNHLGSPKVWYGVPSQNALDFEEVFRKYMPEQFKLQPDLLFQLVTMLSPRILKSASVPVYRSVQEEGTFVVTFPRAYHGGFNSGFNCAEAVNFAPADWFDYDQDSIERYREYRRNPVLSHEALLCEVCLKDESPVTASIIHSHVRDMILKEASLRQESFSHATRYKKVECTSPDPGTGFGDDDAECAICKQYMHLSACTCKCSPGYHVCLEDMDKMCTCEPHNRTIIYRRTLAELEDMYCKVISRIEGCDVNKKLSEQFGKYSSENPRRMREAMLWTQKASEMLDHGNASKRDVEQQIEKAEIFLWGGHAMDEVRKLVEGLHNALEWGGEVASCLSAKRRKLEMEYVCNLIKADPKPLDVDLSRLQKWIREAERMNEEASRALQAKGGNLFTFEEVKQLLKTANSSVIVLPLLEELRVAVARVQQWCDEVNQLIHEANAEKKPPFSLLAALKHQGSTFSWKIKEKEELQNAIEKVELFQRESDTLLEKKPTLEELSLHLSNGASIPVSIPQWFEVQRRVNQASSWVLEAQNATLTFSNLRKLRQILHSGVRIPVYIHEVEQLRLDIRKLEWTETMTKALKGKPKPTVLSLENLVREGITSLGYEKSEELIQRAEKMLEDIAVWDRSSESLVNDQLPKLHELEVLVQSGNEIGVFSDKLKLFSSTLSKVQKWRKEVSLKFSHLHDHYERINDISLVEPVYQLDPFYYEEDTNTNYMFKLKLPISMLEIEALNEKVDAYTQQTEDFKRLQSKEEEVKNWISKAQGCNLCNYKECGFVQPEDISVARNLLLEGIRIGVEHPILSAFRSNVESVAWNLKSKFLLGQKGRVSLTDWQFHIEKAESLEIDEQLKTDLVFRTRQYLECLDEFQKLFVPSEGRVTSSSLHSFHQKFREICIWESEDEMSIRLSNEAKNSSDDAPQSMHSRSLDFDKMIANLQSWKAQSEELMLYYAGSQEAVGKGCMDYEIVCKLKAKFEQGCYSKSTYEREITCINACLSSAENWYQGCKEALVKQSKAQPLVGKSASSSDCGSAINQSLDAIHESLQFVSKILEICSSKDHAEDPEFHSKAQEKLSEASIFCLCRKKIAKRGNSFECECCHSRFHSKCLHGSVGSLTLCKEDKARLGQFAEKADKLCPFCLAQGGIMSSLWKLQKAYATLSSCHSTKCPDVKALADLHKAALQIPINFKESDKIQAILLGLKNLDLKLNFVHPSNARLYMTAFKYMLSLELNLDIGKSVGDSSVVGFPGENVKSKLFNWMYYPIFRRIVNPFLAEMPEKRFQLDFLREVIERAGYFAIPETMGGEYPGGLVSFLKQIESEACEWIRKADAIIEDLQYPLEDAKAHLSKADALRVDVSDISEELSYRCTLYCICRQPYDANRAMIECDKCNQWFHFDCVGIPETEADKTFVCSSCSGGPPVTGATALNGVLAMETNNFTVANGTGNAPTAGTLATAGATALNGVLAMDTNKFTVANDAAAATAGAALM